MAVLGKLRSLDAFPKIQDDFYSKTLSGGVITMVSGFFMGCLFLSELGAHH
jgi:endoplasmic reticulum-Golgi intermediate compartment protein 3